MALHNENEADESKINMEFGLQSELRSTEPVACAIEVDMTNKWQVIYMKTRKTVQTIAANDLNYSRLCL